MNATSLHTKKKEKEKNEEGKRTSGTKSTKCNDKGTNSLGTQEKQGGVSHCGLAIYI
jgi:hypothetical protein